MAYTPTNWEESATSLGPTNLNKMEQGIKAAHDMLEPTAIASLVLDMFYPVGIYVETSDTTWNPNTALGGTWELETEGLVHVSSGTNYPVSSNAQDGGEATHVLTPAETAVRSHRHNIDANDVDAYMLTVPRKDDSGVSRRTIKNGTGSSLENNYYGKYAISRRASTDVPLSTPNGAAHNNMQPYKNINRWHRTA